MLYKRKILILPLVILITVAIIMSLYFFNISDIYEEDSDWPYCTINYVKVKNIQPQPLKIAIVDTGINVLQNSFNGVNIKTYTISDEIKKDDKHGTMVTGIICSSKVLNDGNNDLLSKASIYSIDVGSEKSITIDSLIKGINTAVELKSDIINVSIGTYKGNKELEKSIDRAVKNGVIVVCACGNDFTKQYLYPASYNGVITVAAVDDSNNFLINHNFNDRITISAPGYKIPTNLYDEMEKKHIEMDGSSASAAFITSIAIALKSIKPNLTAHDFINAISKTAKDIGEPGKDNNYGYGLLNFRGAVLYSRNPLVYIVDTIIHPY